jgi:hypothetical protein
MMMIEDEAEEEEQGVSKASRRRIERNPLA